VLRGGGKTCHYFKVSLQEGTAFSLLRDCDHFRGRRKGTSRVLTEDTGGGCHYLSRGAMYELIERAEKNHKTLQGNCWGEKGLFHFRKRMQAICPGLRKGKKEGAGKEREERGGRGG